MFERTLRDPQGPLRRKAVLLVTNKLEFLPFVDKIVVMGRRRREGDGAEEVAVVDQVRGLMLLLVLHSLCSALVSVGVVDQVRVFFNPLNNNTAAHADL